MLDRRTRRVSRRSVIGWGALFGVAGLMTACGQSAPSAPTSPSASTGATPASNPTSQPQAAAQPASGGTTINWLVRSEPRENPWEKNVAIPKFIAGHPGVAVNLIISPGSDWNAKVMSMYAGGTPPDVHNGIVGTFIQLYAQGKVKELTPYLAGDKIDVSVFGKLAHDPDMCRDGKQWCLPILTTLAMPIFFNMDLFDKAGVPYPPTDPTDKTWTIDKIAEIAGKLTKDWGTANATYGLATPDQFHMWAYLWGVDPWLKEWYEHGIAQKSNYTQPKVTEALQFRSDLINKMKVSPRPADEQGMAQLGDIFKTGRVAMYWAGGNGYWTYSDITAFKWGVAPGPWKETNKAVNFTDPVLVSGESKIPDQAWSLVSYLTGKDGQTDYVHAIGTPSTRQDVLDVWLDYELPKTGMKSKDDLKKVALYYENDYIDNWAHYTINAGQFQTIQTQDGSPIWQAKTTAADEISKIQQDMDDALGKAYDQYKSTPLLNDTLCQPIQASSSDSLVSSTSCQLTQT